MSRIIFRLNFLIYIFLGVFITGLTILLQSTEASTTSEICMDNFTIKNCGSSCIEKFRRDPNSSLMICRQISNLCCFNGTQSRSSTSNLEWIFTFAIAIIITSHFDSIKNIVSSRRNFLLLLFLIAFMAISTIPQAEGVRCHVCPNQGSLVKTCLGNDTQHPTNEIVEECPNGCYESFEHNASSKVPFISRGCEKHYGPLKCWNVDGCLDLTTDKQHTCSCGTNLCNKNLACFTGERDPPTTTPSAGNSIISISLDFIFISLIINQL